MTGIFRVIAFAVLIYAAWAVFQRVAVAYELHKARKAVATTLDALPVGQRRPAALQFYLSYYWGSVVAFPALCQEKGVDLHGYADAFKARYETEHEQVRQAYAKLGGSERPFREAARSDTAFREAFANKLVELDSLFHRGDAVTDKCHEIADKQQKVVEKMSFREVMPYPWQLTGLP
jgi:hypothetical protein